MWCDNCNYMPKEYEEKYMICPQCNSLVERNLPKDPSKRSYIYSYSQKLINMKRIVRNITIIVLIIYLISDFYFSHNFYSNHTITGDLLMARNFNKLFSSARYSVNKLAAISSMSMLIPLYFINRYKLTKLQNIAIIIIYLLSSIVIYKIVTDIVLQYLYNIEMDHLIKFARLSTDYNGWLLAIKHEMLLIKTFLYESFLLKTIINSIVFFAFLPFFSKTARLQEKLIEEFGD